jgi:RNA polymerase sigma-70 factor (ECF subfamily)
MSFSGIKKARSGQTPETDSTPRSKFRLVGEEAVSLREQPDETLMLMHADGSEEAFEELVRRHQKGVLNYVFRMVQNRQVAEEVCQEVFLALVKNAQRYQPTAKFTTYIYTIASNLVTKEWTYRRRNTLLSRMASWFGLDEDEGESAIFEMIPDRRPQVDTQVERTEITEAVNKALHRLPETQRQAFVLHRFQGMGYDEIAKIADVPIGTVKSRIARAESALRPMLARYREYIQS